jgi:RimJ/RimL family protein N-acetyltransferase
LNWTFRPLSRSDLGMLCDWVGREHVREWWREPSTLQELEEDYFPVEEASTTRAYIVLLDGQPVGFIQSYVAMGSGEGWWEGETDPGVRGIDQFLADEQRLNQGLGSAMVRAFVEQIFLDPSVTKVQTDPSPDNARAIRSYSKAGFHPVREMSTPDGPALVMVCLRPRRVQR